MDGKMKGSWVSRTAHGRFAQSATGVPSLLSKNGLQQKIDSNKKSTTPSSQVNE
jgi:hypothetical protein